MSDTISWVRAVPGILAVGVGVGAALGCNRISRTRASSLAMGAGVWAASVALKVAWSLPTNAAVRGALPGLVGERLAEPLYWLYIGLLTGIFEVGATVLAVRVTRLRHAERDEALAFGVGFGAAEAVVVGLLGLVPLALVLLAPGVLPPGSRAALENAYAAPITVTTVVAAPIERASALVFHVVTCALVVHGFRVARASRWIALAFVYKAAIDAVAAWAVLSWGVAGSNAKVAALEAGFTVFAIVSGLTLHYLLRAKRAPLLARDKTALASSH